MQNKTFIDLAREVINYNKDGMELLIEINELQKAISNLAREDERHQLIKEIIEKEKVAIILIQQSTIIQRGLMKKQHEAIEKLINNLT